MTPLERYLFCKNEVIRLFKTRPVATTAVVASSLFWTFGSAVGILGTHENHDEINQIRAQFCSSHQPRCDSLLDALLKNPTPEQRAKIRAIAGDH